MMSLFSVVLIAIALVLSPLVSAQTWVLQGTQVGSTVTTSAGLSVPSNNLALGGVPNLLLTTPTSGTTFTVVNPLYTLGPNDVSNHPALIGGSAGSILTSTIQSGYALTTLQITAVSNCGGATNPAFEYRIGSTGSFIPVTSTQTVSQANPTACTPAATPATSNNGFDCSSYYYTIPVTSSSPFTSVQIQELSCTSSGGSGSTAYSIFEQGSGTVVGDPQFVGLRGQSFQVHGIDGAVYNLITDSSMQVNARFAFLRSGRCPTAAQTGGQTSPLSNCFSHPGSYIGEMSIQLLQDSTLTQMVAVSGPANTGFSRITVDNAVVRPDQVIEVGQFKLNRTGSHTVEISTPLFNFYLDSSDLFINQRLRSNVPLNNLKTHGLIGQTNKRPSNPGSLKHVEGEVDDYAVLSENLLGNDFVYNQFNPTQ